MLPAARKLKKEGEASITKPMNNCTSYESPVLKQYYKGGPIYLNEMLLTFRLPKNQRSICTHDCGCNSNVPYKYIGIDDVPKK